MTIARIVAFLAVLVLSTSPVLAPSSATRLTTVKIAIATITGPARSAPRAFVTTARKAKLAAP